MCPKSEEEAHQFIHTFVVFAKGDAFRLDDEETLKGVDDFLYDFPVFRVFLDGFDIAFKDFVYFLVLFDEDEQQVVGSLTHFSLTKTKNTFSSESKPISAIKL